MPYNWLEKMTSDSVIVRNHRCRPQFLDNLPTSSLPKALTIYFTLHNERSHIHVNTVGGAFDPSYRKF